jgi:hypothetical protein
MPKSKKPLVVPTYEYGNSSQIIGEIVLDMAQKLLIDRLTQPNQLEVMRRKDEFVRQVNKVFAIRLANAKRLANAGEKGGLAKKAEAQEKNDEFMPNVKICIDSLKAEGTRVTTKTIGAKWEGLKIKVSPPSDRQLSRLKNLILSQP